MLRGKKITDIYSQEKDVLFLQLENETPDEFPALAISANFQTPYVLLKKNQRKAKKNYAEFCADLLPLRIEKISTADDDRIIKTETDSLDIYFPIRGPKTNVIFVKENQWVREFKKTNDANELKTLAEELRNKNFISEPQLFFERIPEKFKREIIDEEIERQIRTAFPQLNKEIFLQFRSRGGKTFDDLKETVREILEDEIAVTRLQNNKISLAPATWNRLTENAAETFLFDEFQPALAKYVALKHKFDSFSRLFAEISKKTERDLEYYSNRLNDLRTRIENGSRSDEYKKIGDLLLANIYKLKKGMTEISLEDFETGETVTVKLDAKLSPNKNADKYYEKARDEKINFEKSKQLFEQFEKKYAELLEIKENLATIADTKSLLEIKKKLKLDDSKKKYINEPAIKYRKFIIDGKYQAFAGKDAKSNDLLTLKFAKQNDLWFHARGVTGSHVILRIENAKEAIPKSVLKKVASLAAFFSKAKTAKLVPVAYTFRKFVHKKKGMPPGQVIISRETVLIVPPEIPENTEEIYD